MERYRRPLSIAYLDCDNFKWVNDSLGHAEGNRLLRILASGLEKNVRRTDFAARLGGDEFALLLPETDYEAARVAIARVRSALTDLMRRQGWPTTLSIGLLTCIAPPPSVEAIIHQADRLMYGAKNAGKNTFQHELYEGEPVPVRT
jgi:diguanylate cyclase (GGDEF)-like protein